MIPLGGALRQEEMNEKNNPPESPLGIISTCTMRVFFPAESSLFLIELIFIQLELLLHPFKTAIIQQPASTTSFN